MPDVLICDPDRNHAESWSQPIEASGYTVAFVENGSLAVERVLEKPCGMAFVSVGANGDSGTDTISMLHDVDSEMPVVAVAERDSLDLQREVRSRKVFYYLVEPVDSEELATVVSRALASRPAGEV